MREDASFPFYICLSYIRLLTTIAIPERSYSNTWKTVLQTKKRWIRIHPTNRLFFLLSLREKCNLHHETNQSIRNTRDFDVVVATHTQKYDCKITNKNLQSAKRGIFVVWHMCYILLGRISSGWRHRTVRLRSSFLIFRNLESGGWTIRHKPTVYQYCYSTHHHTRCRERMIIIFLFLSWFYAHGITFSQNALSLPEPSL